jgi:hypothetical protein
MHAKFLSPVLVLVGLLIAPRAAEAVVIALDSSAVIPHELTEVVFSKADCEAPISLDYDVTDIAASDDIGIWVSEGDCLDPTTRAAASQTCFKLDAKSTGNPGNTFYDFALGPHEIAAALGITNCEDTTPSRTVTLWVLVNASSGASADVNASLMLTMDFVGPAAPTIDSVGAENGTSLEVNFTSVDGSGAVSFNAYCEQAGQVTATTSVGAGGATSTSSSGGAGGNGTQSAQGWKTYGGVGGGGTGGAGGAGGVGGTNVGAGGTGGTAGATGTGGTTTSTGGSSGSSSSTGSGGASSGCDDPAELDPGTIPTVAVCGTSTNSPVTATVSAGFNYWVGIAGVDNVGNIGPISELTCTTPTDVDDFWSDYLANGGTAGGGICACATVGARHTGLAFTGWAIACLAMFVRRRRREEELD